MSTGVFAFRMLVCQFRRELTFDDVFGFWERLWAAEQMAHCQLKVCLSEHTCEPFCASSKSVCLSIPVTRFVPAQGLSVCLSEHTCDPFCLVQSIATINPFVKSFIRTCLHTCLHSVIHLSFHSFVGSSNSLFVHTLITRSFIHAFIPAFPAQDLDPCDLISLLCFPLVQSYPFTAQVHSLRFS